MAKNFRIALLCGGPSLERGISLNSARSVMDHLTSSTLEIVPFYFDVHRRPYKISRAQLYSNTPSDFDFKLKQTAIPLTNKQLIHELKTVHIAFPVMHGAFGEDGAIQRFLEKNNVPFVGSGSFACSKAFDKFNSNVFIKQHGFFTLPATVLKIYHADHEKILQDFFHDHHVQRAVVKPASGGSSIGVFSVTTVQEALEKAQALFSKRMDTRVVVEPFAQGIEFTVIVLENRFGLPVALPPTEIKTDYTKNQVFDFRRKYLPTGQVTWYCPPRFDNNVIEKIQAQAEQLFALFGMHDVARFDGWVLPDGNVWFSDFNPVSGMEQNSFLFQQASRIGMTHTDILMHIVGRACARQHLTFIKAPEKSHAPRKKINILMGGDTSERQVSLMSGTNVWLKLRRSSMYQPQPHVLDASGNVWCLPYHLCLNHTTEEIIYNCERYDEAKKRLNEFEERARVRLGLCSSKNNAEFFEPYKLSLENFVRKSEFVFIALHGGDGENGTLQKMLEEHNVPFNGPDHTVSRLCMDKWDTAQAVRHAQISGVHAIESVCVSTAEILGAHGTHLDLFWKNVTQELGTKTVVVKPRADGCSTGVVHLYGVRDLEIYASLLAQRVPCVPKGTFKGQRDFIELPVVLPEHLVFEKFIQTDSLRVSANKLKYQANSGWVEITIGVIERDGRLEVFNPSITVAEGDVLSVEEKFQGGTGVNITPPPRTLMSARVRCLVQQRIKNLAVHLGIRGYARIDAFVHCLSGRLLIIEVNTLPALTPSTVFYQQALAQEQPLFPHELAELLIQNKDCMLQNVQFSAQKIAS